MTRAYRDNGGKSFVSESRKKRKEFVRVRESESPRPDSQRSKPGRAVFLPQSHCVRDLSFRFADHGYIKIALCLRVQSRSPHDPLTIFFVDPGFPSTLVEAAA